VVGVRVPVEASFPPLHVVQTGSGEPPIEGVSRAFSGDKEYVDLYITPPIYHGVVIN
jgi:hypothetical protein